MKKLYDTTETTIMNDVLQDMKDMMAEIFQEIENDVAKSDFKGIVLYVKGYYEERPENPVYELTMDVSMATTFQWFDEAIVDLLHLDDVIVEIWRK